MTRSGAFALLCLAGFGAFAQPTFEVASVRTSRSIVGHDGEIKIDPGRFMARNATLKRLLFEAWQIPYSQITGGPAWLNTDEYDIEAKPENPATPGQLRLMLRALLVERFKLKVHSDTRERRIYALLVAKGGAKLASTNGSWRFHGDMAKFASVLSLQLTIPPIDDPTIPSRATGTPVPVVDKTGIEGDYDISLDIKTDPGADAFTVWQRALQEQLGLRLESRKGAVEFLVIDHIEKLPSPN